MFRFKEFDFKKRDYYEAELCRFNNIQELDIALREGRIIWIEEYSMSLSKNNIHFLRGVVGTYYSYEIDYYQRLINCEDKSDLLEYLLDECLPIRIIAEIKLKELEK